MATPALGTLPQRGGMENAAPTTPSAADMVGQPPAAETTQQDRSRAFVGQVKNLHTQLDDISRNNPAFAPYARRAQEALKEGMVRTLSEMQSQPEESGSTPNFG